MKKFLFVIALCVLSLGTLGCGDDGHAGYIPVGNPNPNPNPAPADVACQVALALVADYAVAPFTTDLTGTFVMSTTATSLTQISNECSANTLSTTGFDLMVGQLIDPVNGNLFGLANAGNIYYGTATNSSATNLTFTLPLLNVPTAIAGCLVDYTINNGLVQPNAGNTGYTLTGTLGITLKHATDIENCNGIL